MKSRKFADILTPSSPSLTRFYHSIHSVTKVITPRQAPNLRHVFMNDSKVVLTKWFFLQDCKEAMAQWNANAEASNVGASDELRSSLITQPASKRGSPSSSLNMYTYKTRFVSTFKNSLSHVSLKKNHLQETNVS